MSIKKIFKYRHVIAASAFDDQFEQWANKQNIAIVNSIKQFTESFVKILGDKKEKYLKTISGGSISTLSNNRLLTGKLESLQNFLNENPELAKWLDQELDKLADANTEYENDHPNNKTMEEIAQRNFSKLLVPGDRKPDFFPPPKSKTTSKKENTIPEKRNLEEIDDYHLDRDQDISLKLSSYYDAIDAIITHAGQSISDLNTNLSTKKYENCEQHKKFLELLQSLIFDDSEQKEFDSGEFDLEKYKVEAQKLKDKIEIIKKEFSVAPFEEIVKEFSERLDSLNQVSRNKISKMEGPKC